MFCEGDLGLCGALRGDGKPLLPQDLVLGMRNESAIQKSSLIPLTPVWRVPKDLSDVIRVKYLGVQRQGQDHCVSLHRSLIAQIFQSRRLGWGMVQAAEIQPWFQASGPGLSKGMQFLI